MAEHATKPRRAKKAPPQISDAEWVIMRLLWKSAPLSTGEVVEALADQIPWKPKTVHTLLSRLVKKGALAFTKNGREYVYQPTVSAGECERHVSRSFLDRVFGGDPAPFLACLLASEQLSPTEIARLKRILDGKTQ